MTQTNTATVETLTAEVRVLMVGNRQVTLSVAKQLDRVCYEHLEPFGRVEVARKDNDDYELDERGINIVGRHRETGVLCIAFAPKVVWPSRTQEFWHWSYHGLQQGRLSEGQRISVAEVDGRQLYWYVPRARELGQECECDTPPHVLYERHYPDADDYDAVKHWLYEERRHARNVLVMRQTRGELCDLKELKYQFKADAAEEFPLALAREKLQAEAESLPLIVLAGLK